MIAELITLLALAGEPDGKAIYRGSEQIGWKTADGKFYRLLGPGKLADEPSDEPCACGCGIEKPCKCKDTGIPCKETCRCVLVASECSLPTGVVPEKIRPNVTQINGREVSKHEAISAIEAGIDPNDVNKNRVTVIGDENDCKKVLEAFASDPLLAPFRDKILLQAYPPSNFAVQGLGFLAGGSPAIYIQSPTGQVLHRQLEWRGAEKMASALRKADRTYDVTKDPDLNKPAGLPFNLEPKHLLLVGAGVLVAYLLMRK